MSKTKLISTASTICRFLIFNIIQPCRNIKVKRLKEHPVLTMKISTSHLHLTRRYALRQLTPEDSPGILSTISIESNHFSLLLLLLLLFFFFFEKRKLYRTNKILFYCYSMIFFQIENIKITILMYHAPLHKVAYRRFKHAFPNKLLQCQRIKAI